MSPSPFSNMNFFCSEIFTQLNHNMTFFHGLWMDNVCRSKFEDRLNRFKSYGQKSGQIWVCERFFEKSRGIFIDSIRFFAFLSGTDVQGRWSELRQR